MAINNIRILSPAGESGIFFMCRNVKYTILCHYFVEIFGNYKIMPYICNIKIRDNKSNNKIKNYGKRKFDWFRKK